MRMTWLLLLLAITQSAEALPAWDGLTCSVKDRTFVMDLEMAKAPTFAAVILPNGKLLRLKYDPDGIDTFGPQYGKGRVVVSLAALNGVDEASRQEAVFKEPGTYKFVLQDANTAEGIELHRLQCSVTITKRQLTAPGT